MKRKNISFVLLFVLISMSFIGFFSINGLGASTLTYEFQNDNLFNSTGLGRQSWVDDNPNNFNIRQRENITGDFPATYSFTDETGLEDESISFVDSTNSIDLLKVLSTHDEHDEVLIFGDEGAGYFRHFEELQINGYVEFWMYFYNGTALQVSFYNSSLEYLFYFKLYPTKGRFYRGDGGGGTVFTDFNTNTGWNHYKFYFDNDNDIYSMWLNGDLKYDEVNFMYDSNSNDFELMIFKTYTGGSYGIIDAIGYSWDPFYNVSDNTFPSREKYSDQYEVDKWEFRHNPNTRTQYVDGFDDPSGWTDDEIGDGKVNTLNIGNEFDVVVHIDDDAGLYRNFGGIDDIYYNISYNFRINQLDQDASHPNSIILKVDDQEGDVIVAVYIIHDGTVDVYHDGTSTELSSITLVENFTASFLINFESQLFNFVLSDWDDGTIFFDFFGGFYSDDATNIRVVSYKHVCPDLDVIDSDILSISIYNTTGSISDDIGELKWDEAGYQPDRQYWYYDEFNLISLEGNFQNFSLFHEALGGLSFKNFIYWNIDNIDFANIYEVDSIATSLVNLRLWMYYNFTFESISIDGVKLDEGPNKYPLIFDYGGVDGNLSYFYVQNDRLIFNLNTNDGNLEYIEASFDINNVLAENKSVGFTSNLNGGSNGYLRMNYTDDTSTFIPFPSHATSTSLILPQEKDIDTFVIIITDLDSLSSGSTTGYISNLKLVYFPDVSITITTISLLTIMIPLMILLIPTFAIYKKFGEVAIIPMFMLMSIICFIAELVPVWLFFILMFGSVVMLFTKKKIEGI